MGFRKHNPAGTGQFNGKPRYTSHFVLGSCRNRFYSIYHRQATFHFITPAFFLVFACIYVRAKDWLPIRYIFHLVCFAPLYAKQKLWSFAPDNSVLIYTLVTIYLCIVLYEKEHSQASEVSLKSLITLLASFSFTIKLSSAPICLIPIYFLGEIFIKRAKLRKAFLITAVFVYY